MTQMHFPTPSRIKRFPRSVRETPFVSHQLPLLQLDGTFTKSLSFFIIQIFSVLRYSTILSSSARTMTFKLLVVIALGLFSVSVTAQECLYNDTMCACAFGSSEGSWYV